jgi:hypothetical protein
MVSGSLQRMAGQRLQTPVCRNERINTPKTTKAQPASAALIQMELAILLPAINTPKRIQWITSFLRGRRGSFGVWSVINIVGLSTIAQRPGPNDPSPS